jgi:hypothetical protein
MTGPAIVNFLLERRACRDRSRRDLLVRSATYRLIIHPDATGTTSVPLRHLEGPACQVRCATFDDPSRFIGHDKRAPPNVFLGGTRSSGPRNNV